MNHSNHTWYDHLKVRYGLSANALKWIAIMAMLFGHIAMKKFSLPQTVIHLLYFFAHVTPPIMCYFITEGFRYTRNRQKYALRLLTFAVIAQIPFIYFKTGVLLQSESLNVIFTLLLGFCMLWVIRSSLDVWVKIVLTLLCALASFGCDWIIFTILWILAFGLNTGSFKRQAIWFSIVTLGVGMPFYTYYGYTLGNTVYYFKPIALLFALPLLALYNGKKAGESTPAWLCNKWMFYIFYPLHLAILGLLYYGKVSLF